jgi:branched-chain amino acid transport system permease protein
MNLSGLTAGKKKALLLALCAFLVAAPSLLSGYWIRTLTDIFMFAILAASWNLIAGYCGYPAFGNVVFFGLGAYGTGIFMTKAQLSLLWAVAAGGVLAVILAVLLGFPLLRLKGHYFAIATLGVNEALREIVTNLTDLTGGGYGITLPILPGKVGFILALFYFLMLGLLAAVILLTRIISESRFGFGCRAIRADEDAAAVLGIHTTKYKITAWSLSALFTGLAGGLYAAWMTYIDPVSVFDMSISVKFCIMVLLGGAGTVWGPVMGALILEGISVLIWSEFIVLHAAILGFIIILVVILMPRGFMQFIRGRLSMAVLLANIRENRI